MSKIATRDTAVQIMLKHTKPFTIQELAERSPGVPLGTLSSIVSRMRTGGGLRRERDDDGTVRWHPTSRWPKTVSGARTMMARAQRELRNGHRPRRRLAEPRATAPRIEPATALVARIREWQTKAAVLDALIADLALTPADLKPYQS